MGMFLNSIEPYDKYKTITKGLYFVDKTELLEELIPALEQDRGAARSSPDCEQG